MNLMKINCLAELTNVLLSQEIPNFKGSSLIFLDIPKVSTEIKNAQTFTCSGTIASLVTDCFHARNIKNKWNKINQPIFTYTNIYMVRKPGKLKAVKQRAYCLMLNSPTLHKSFVSTPLITLIMATCCIQAVAVGQLLDCTNTMSLVTVTWPFTD